MILRERIPGARADQRGEGGDGQRVARFELSEGLEVRARLGPRRISPPPPHRPSLENASHHHVIGPAHYSGLQFPLNLGNRRVVSSREKQIPTQPRRIAMTTPRE